MVLRSEVVYCEPESIFDEFYARGWTDGLPITPPTPERVEAMIEAAGLHPDEIVATLQPSNAPATVEKLAINAVMAGCLPAHFPIVIAATQAVSDPRFNLGPINGTTHPGSPALIVNGPVRQQIELNCGYGVMGPGWRANATIGRGLSLIMLNVAGRIPGKTSQSTHAFPGRYGMCIGELEEESPWAPLSVERGFLKDDSTVTVVAISGTMTIEDPHSRKAEDLLIMIAGGLRAGQFNNIFPHFGRGAMVLVMSPHHANLLARDGVSKADVKHYLWEHTRNIPISNFAQWRIEEMRTQGRGQVTEQGVALARYPENFMIVVAGGPGGLHTRFCETYADSTPITTRVQLRPEGQKN